MEKILTLVEYYNFPRVYFSYPQMSLFAYSLIMLGIQGPSGSEGPPPPDPDYVVHGPQDPAPIDGSLWILILLAIVLGIYIAYQRNRATDKAP